MKTFSLFILILLLAGCELFDTRDPQSPAGDQGSWETPQQPRDVLTNLGLSLFEKNAANYLRSFDADSFLFIADPAVQQQQPSIAGWDYAREQSHINSLFSEGSLPSDSAVFVVFTQTDETVLGDSAQVIASYSLTAQLALAGRPGDMRGESQFWFRVGREGYWVISRWTDLRTESEASWSDLKALVQ